MTTRALKCFKLNNYNYDTKNIFLPNNLTQALWCSFLVKERDPYIFNDEKDDSPTVERFHGVSVLCDDVIHTYGENGQDHVTRLPFYVRFDDLFGGGICWIIVNFIYVWFIFKLIYEIWVKNTIHNVVNNNNYPLNFSFIHKKWLLLFPTWE